MKPVQFNAQSWDSYQKRLNGENKLREAEGGAISAIEASKITNIPLPSIRRALTARHIFSWQDQGVVYIPRWQFCDTGVIKGIPECIAFLGHIDENSILNFFVGRNHNPRIIDLLRAGKPEVAIEAAKKFKRNYKPMM